MEITLIPNSVYPPDWNVVKAIQHIDPSFVYLWVKWPFRNADTGEIRVMGYHGLGRIVDNPHSTPYKDWDCVLPTYKPNGVKVGKPHIIEAILYNASLDRTEGFPGRYVPFDWNVYHWVVRNYGHHSVKDLKKELIADKKEAWEKTRKKNLEELAYIDKDTSKFVDKMIDRASDVEKKEYMLGTREKSKPLFLDVGKA